MKMKTFLYIILVLMITLFALSRGVHEGIIMTQNQDVMHTGELDGLKGHTWFPIYHIINTIPYIILAGAVLLWTNIRKNLNLFFYISIMFIMWEFYEIAHTFTRTGTVIPVYEHINFLDMISFRIRGMGLYLLHIFRMAIIVVSLIFSRR